MSAMIAIFLAAAAAPATPAPPPPPAPSVSMDVAKARVAKLKTLLAVAVSGDSATLNSVAATGANANMSGTISPLAPAAIAPLKDCTRNGPYTVNEDGVMLRMKCTGTLPADATLLVTYTDEKISSVVAGPSAPSVTAPPVAAPAGAQ